MVDTDTTILVKKLCDKEITVYVHKYLSQNDCLKLAFNMGMQLKDAYKDNDAHVISLSRDCIAYRIKNEIYFIPATLVAVVNNGDDKVNLWFDYPVAMDRKELEVVK